MVTEEINEMTRQSSHPLKCTCEIHPAEVVHTTNALGQVVCSKMCMGKIKEWQFKVKSILYYGVITHTSDYYFYGKERERKRNKRRERIKRK